MFPEMLVVQYCESSVEDSSSVMVQCIDVRKRVTTKTVPTSYIDNVGIDDLPG